MKHEINLTHKDLHTLIDVCYQNFIHRKQYTFTGDKRVYHLVKIFTQKLKEESNYNCFDCRNTSLSVYEKEMKRQLKIRKTEVEKKC